MSGSGYTKLFASITDSTIWQAPDATRLVWITMLALADQNGYVGASVPGLASRARVSLPDCLAALETFRQPDEWSRTPDFEGRRIIDADGGWFLLNHAKYRAIQDAEARREKARLAMAKLRASRKESATVNNVNGGDRKLAQEEAEEDTKKKKQKIAPDGVLFPGVSQQVIADFKALRNKLHAPATETAMAGIRREAEKAGLSLEQAMAMCCERGWRGFKAEWVQGTAKNEPAALPRLLA